MKISIITISFNAEKTIEDTIVSVLNQTFPHIEYIIVDGLSTDKTLKIVSKYQDKIHKIVSEKDAGLYDAMNKGVDLATGDVIGILNADDFYFDQFVIEKVMKLFDKDIDGVYGDLVYVDALNTNQLKRKWISGEYHDGMFLKGWMPPHPTFFVRKSVYQKFGKFNTLLKSSADYELMLRFIHKHKIRLNYLNEVIVKMRVGGQSNASIKNRIKANKEDRLAWKMNDLKPNKFTFIRKPLSKISQFFKK